MTRIKTLNYGNNDDVIVVNIIKNQKFCGAQCVQFLLCLAIKKLLPPPLTIFVIVSNALSRKLELSRTHTPCDRQPLQHIVARIETLNSSPPSTCEIKYSYIHVLVIIYYRS